MPIVNIVDIEVYSGGIGGGTLVSPSVAHHNNYLFTCTLCFFRNALSARPYRWLKKIIRGIIYVGVNTLSRVYKLKQ